MEPITFTAIVAALTASATAGVGQAAGESLFTDAYRGLKAMLKRKFGSDSEVAKAVENLEKKPDSPGRQETLKEEVEAAGADQDPDVRQAAQELLEQIQAQPGGEAHIQTAVGNYIAQADRGSTAKVNVNPLPPRKPRSFPPKTGAELVDYWRSEGLIGSRPEIADSRGHARGLRHQAERRARE